MITDFTLAAYAEMIFTELPINPVHVNCLKMDNEGAERPRLPRQPS